MFILRSIGRCCTNCLYVTEEVSLSEHMDDEPYNEEEQVMMENDVAATSSYNVNRNEDDDNDHHDDDDNDNLHGSRHNGGGTTNELQDYSHFDGHTSTPPPPVSVSPPLSTAASSISTSATPVTPALNKNTSDIQAQLNPLALELSPMEYERQWANCSMSGTRSYALDNDLVRAILLLGSDGDRGNNIGDDDDIDDDGDREERAWKQINQIEALFLKYNIYTLASDQALLSNRQMKRRIYMFAERILRERSQQQHEFISQLYLVELVIDLNASEIQVRVKTSSPSSLDSSGGSDDRSISDFLSLLDQILVDLATPKNQVEGKKKRRRHHNNTNNSSSSGKLDSKQ